MICVDLQIVSYWRIIQHVSRNKPPRAEMDKEKFSFKSRWFSGQTTVMWTEFPPQYVEAQTPPAGQTYSWCSARGRRFKPRTTHWQARALQAQLAVLVGIGVCQTWGIFPESSLLPPLVGQGARQWGEGGEATSLTGEQKRLAGLVKEEASVGLHPPQVDRWRLSNQDNDHRDNWTC